MMSKLNVNNIFWIILTALLVAVAVFFFDIYKQPVGTLYQKDSWEVEYEDGRILDNVDLYELRIDHNIKKGEIVKLRNIIPQTSNEHSSDYMMMCENADIRVFVDGNLIYSYGKDNYRSGKMPGSGYHILHIEKEYELKPIVIEYTAAFDFAFSYFSVSEIHGEGQAFLDFYNENMILVFILMFLGIFGIMIMIIGLLRYKHDNEFVYIIPFGFYVSIMGFWLLERTHIINVFSMNYSLHTTLEHFAGTIAPIPIMMLIFTALKELPPITAWKQKVLEAAAVIVFIEIAILTLLHIFGIKDYTETAWFFELSVVLGVAVIFVLFFEVRKSAEVKQVLGMIIGITVIGVSTPVFLVVGWLNRIVSLGNPFSMNVLFSIIIMAITVVFIDLYFVLLHREAFKNAKSKLGEDIVNIDLNTGYYNRAFCIETVKEAIDNKKDFDITLIRISNLREIFLTKGGKTVEEVISYMSDALDRCFGEEYLRFRFCTDDFVMFNTKRQGVDKKGLAMLMNNIEEIEGVVDTNVKITYGYTSSDEVGGNFNSVFDTLYKKNMDMLSNKV